MPPPQVQPVTRREHPGRQHRHHQRDENQLPRQQRRPPRLEHHHRIAVTSSTLRQLQEQQPRVRPQRLPPGGEPFPPLLERLLRLSHRSRHRRHDQQRAVLRRLVPDVVDQPQQPPATVVLGHVLQQHRHVRGPPPPPQPHRTRPVLRAQVLEEGVRQQLLQVLRRPPAARQPLSETDEPRRVPGHHERLAHQPLRLPPEHAPQPRAHRPAPHREQGQQPGRLGESTVEPARGRSVLRIDGPPVPSPATAGTCPGARRRPAPATASSASPPARSAGTAANRSC